MAFSLEKFEHFTYSRNHEMALRELVALLMDIDDNYGNTGAGFSITPLRSIRQHELNEHTWTRVCSSISCLLSDPALVISDDWRQRLLSMHRWLSALFAASPFHNADHVLRGLNQGEQGSDLSVLNIQEKDLLKLCWLYTTESEVGIDLDRIWAYSPVMAASLCISLLSPRFQGGAAGHLKRELILPWLTKYLDQIEDVESLPVGVLHDVYMHCSYADRKDKHDIKKPINVLLRRKMSQSALVDSVATAKLPNAGEFGVPAKKSTAKKDRLASSMGANEVGKPVLLVVLEWFSSAHSIYRTHSLTLEGASDHFHVIGMAYERCVDETTKKVFDEFIPIEEKAILDQIRQIQKVAQERQVQICYMPSVGMFQLTMWLSNLRVAPLQMMALGHPATTHSDKIDYVVVEEDYVGDEKCFSESLLKLPTNGMPYRPSAAMAQVQLPAREKKELIERVEVVMCATTMKLNPRFLDTCRQIVLRSKVAVRMHFLVGQAQGVTFPHVERVVRDYLGDAVIVYPHQAYPDYMKVIGTCDLFINPFPFGNTNGIIDTVTAGLVGVCMTGPEVHEHIDEGLFRRLQFPDWLIARNTEEYITAALRLIENHSERQELEGRLSGLDALKVIYQGDPKAMGRLMMDRLQTLARASAVSP